VVFRANVGKYSIHGANGIGNMKRYHEILGYIPQLFLDKAIFRDEATYDWNHRIRVFSRSGGWDYRLPDPWYR
jgi:hypothetical protein